MSNCCSTQLLKATRKEAVFMEERKENRLGTVPVNRLLITMSLPIMLSMLVQALYNIVDSMYVARVSDAAFTALSLAFPAQNLMIAVGAGTAVGINSLMSRRLGEKNFADANLAAVNGLFLSVLAGAAFALFGIFGSRTFFMAFVDDPVIVELGVEYLSTVCIGSFGLFLAITGERLSQLTGTSVYNMISQMTGAITNIILDPIMIFGLFGFPAMGVKGAALATVIGQFMSVFVIFYCNNKYNHEIQINFKGFKPNARIIGDIYKVGLPSILMQAIGSVMTFGMNKILISFSQVAVNVFGAYFKIQSFVFMPIFGLNNGMIPIIGYNFGAKNKQRIFRCIRSAMIVAGGIMFTGMLVFQLAPAPLLIYLFDASEEMVSVGVPALRTISLCFIPAAIGIVLSGTFQALAVGTNSMIMSFCRQLVALLPAAYLLGKTFGLNAVWFSFPIAEIFSLSIALLMYTALYNKKLKNL